MPPPGPDQIDWCLVSPMQSTQAIHVAPQFLPKYLRLHLTDDGPLGPRAQVSCSGNLAEEFWDPELEAKCDAFISTYVFDLLNDNDISIALVLAWRYAIAQSESGACR